MPGRRSITEAEKPAAAKLGGIPIHRDQMAVVANIHRAASAVRQHLENSVLRGADLGPGTDAERTASERLSHCAYRPLTPTNG